MVSIEFHGAKLINYNYVIRWESHFFEAKSSQLLAGPAPSHKHDCLGAHSDRVRVVVTLANFIFFLQNNNFGEAHLLDGTGSNSSVLLFTILSPTSC